MAVTHHATLAQTRLRPEWPRLAALLATALTVGVLAQVADGYQELSEVSSRGGIWFAMLAVIGATSPSLRAAGGRAVAFGLMSLVGYYVMTAIDSGWAPPWRTVWFWTAAAVTLAPGVAVVAHWTWNGGHRYAWLGFGLGGGLLLGEAVDVLLGESSRRGPSFVVALVTGVAILAAGSWRTGEARRVLVTAAAAVPLGLLALQAMEAAYRAAIGGGFGSWF